MLRVNFNNRLNRHFPQSLVQMKHFFFLILTKYMLTASNSDNLKDIKGRKGNLPEILVPI